MEGYLASSAASTTRQRIFTVHVIQMRCSGNDGWVKPLDAGLHDLSEDRAKNVAENVQEGLSVGFLLVAPVDSAKIQMHVFVVPVEADLERSRLSLSQLNRDRF